MEEAIYETIPDKRVLHRSIEAFVCSALNPAPDTDTHKELLVSAREQLLEKLGDVEQEITRINDFLKADLPGLEICKSVANPRSLGVRYNFFYAGNYFCAEIKPHRGEQGGIINMHSSKDFWLDYAYGIYAPEPSNGLHPAMVILQNAIEQLVSSATDQHKKELSKKFRGRGLPPRTPLPL